MNDKIRIAYIVRRVSIEKNFERGVICAWDCLHQWELGLLDETILAWERYLNEIKSGEGHTDTLRHNAWVPAIPL